MTADDIALLRCLSDEIEAQVGTEAAELVRRACGELERPGDVGRDYLADLAGRLSLAADDLSGIVRAIVSEFHGMHYGRHADMLRAAASVLGRLAGDRPAPDPGHPAT